MEKDSVEMYNIVSPKIDELLRSNSPRISKGAIEITHHYGMKEKDNLLAELFSASTHSEVKIAALEALQSLEYGDLSTVLKMAMKDDLSEVKAKAISLVPLSKLTDSHAVELISLALQAKSLEVRQAAIHSLASYDDPKANEELSKFILSLEQGKLELAMELDLIEAIEISNNQSLKEQLDKVFSNNEDPLARWVSALEGGDYRKGRRIFNNHAGAQCTRCHTIFEVGGDAGPGLADVGSRLSNRAILESLVEPSAVLAPGYGATSLILNDDTTMAGIILRESAEEIILKIGEDRKSIPLSKVRERTDIPSSMPPMKDILTIREMRDLIAFLKAQKAEES
jgi:putative heme-binding domain-containing protein